MPDTKPMSDERLRMIELTFTPKGMVQEVCTEVRRLKEREGVLVESLDWAIGFVYWTRGSETYSRCCSWQREAGHKPGCMYHQAREALEAKEARDGKD